MRFRGNGSPNGVGGIEASPNLRGTWDPRRIARFFGPQTRERPKRSNKITTRHQTTHALGSLRPSCAPVGRRKMRNGPNNLCGTSGDGGANAGAPERERGGTRGARAPCGAVAGSARGRGRGGQGEGPPPRGGEGGAEGDHGGPQ